MARHYKVHLHRINSSHNNLRTNVIEGVCRDLPALNEGFTLTGEGLEFGVRSVRTTRVQSLARLNQTILFETQNSVYALFIVDEFDDEAQNI